jgi:hypothetical protein
MISDAGSWNIIPTAKVVPYFARLSVFATWRETNPFETSGFTQRRKGRKASQRQSQGTARRSHAQNRSIARSRICAHSFNSSTGTNSPVR